MMGRHNQDQGQLFYSFNLEEAVPQDHQVRGIAAVLDLSWLHGELAPHYSNTGRPSIDPALNQPLILWTTQRLNNLSCPSPDLLLNVTDCRAPCTRM